MDKQRAKQIADSPVTANVMYNDTAVYIQHVSEENDTVRIYPLGQPENEQNVSVSQLVEN
ncbi:small, acid-soluble spore protein, H family [Priestia megaterium]|uniref:H-type small acid-soluble spore protein n=1 Tax=Priestia megaterium TaxID=1404 RepID=UPI00094C49E7|nr:H-type small acid-soluble spore protein [Priestia megaterium]MCM3096124.1 H-type small acid-soluble spore protein [Priestia megaterium]OLO39823.1 small, acid-soluble spore protein, H family [Priestia megaterium]